MVASQATCLRYPCLNTAMAGNTVRQIIKIIINLEKSAALTPFCKVGFYYYPQDCHNCMSSMYIYVIVFMFVHQRNENLTKTIKVKVKVSVFI